MEDMNNALLWVLDQIDGGVEVDIVIGCVAITMGLNERELKNEYMNFIN